MEFKVGDVVRLKSGGPEMTVKEYPVTTWPERNTVVGCCWFDNGEAQTRNFPPETLEKIQGH